MLWMRLRRERCSFLESRAKDARIKMEVDLTNFELFKSFSEFEKDGIYVDLHNDFDCKAIEYSQGKKQLTLSFKPNEYCALTIKNVQITFDDCSIQTYSSKHDKSDTDSSTIDIMYRGRIELSNHELAEILNGRYYYFINFLPDRHFELLAKHVTAIFE